MTEREIEAYCVANGVPFNRRPLSGVERLRIMDVTQLPMAMREFCDERGFVKIETPAPLESEEKLTANDLLPVDFPGHAALAAEGITTFAQVREVEDLTSIAGIGEVTAEKIAEAMED